MLFRLPLIRTQATPNADIGEPGYASPVQYRCGSPDYDASGDAQAPDPEPVVESERRINPRRTQNAPFLEYYLSSALALAGKLNIAQRAHGMIFSECRVSLGVL